LSERRFALLVNPHAGGGRAGRLLPEVEATLREFGLDVDRKSTRLNSSH